MNKTLEELKLEIEKLASLSPSKKVNATFSQLVQIATKFGDKKIKLQNFFQKKAALAEVEMEKYWAKKIINSENPKETLAKFWYYKNYLDLTKLEFGSLSLCHDHKKHSKVLFIGSGPLPLTGIFLAREFGCEVTLMDIDQNFFDLSKALCESLDIEKISFVCSDAFNFLDYQDFDVIFVAAMVENDLKTKEDFINMLAKYVNTHTHILVRSVFHNRELLYKKFDVKKIVGLKAILEVRPKNGIVNSFHVFEK